MCFLAGDGVFLGGTGNVRRKSNLLAWSPKTYWPFHYAQLRSAGEGAKSVFYLSHLAKVLQVFVPTEAVKLLPLPCEPFPFHIYFKI
ncbi:hypothetical protein TNCV_4687661 [Trichonephila clavipes]|nr:hypothetical protein TNCV_4687661 [Trichonephila clavipes]